MTARGNVTVDRRHSPSRLPDLSTLAKKLRVFARRGRALPLIYIEFASEGRVPGADARRRSAAYKQAAAAALKASVGSVLRKGDLVAAGTGGSWFVALLTARTTTTRLQTFDADLGVAAERLRHAVQVEFARVRAQHNEGLAHRVTVRSGWNVLEPATEPLEALRHAVRGAALVARIEERRATVLAAVTHELRTPLTAIIGFGERLQREKLGRAQRRRYLDIIVEESKRLHRLAEGLIDVGSWSAGSLRLDPQPTDMAAILAAAVSALAERAAAKRVTIRITGEARARVDRDRCQQIFINLIDNAVRHSPRGGSVEVMVKQPGRASTVSVKDQGPGFTPEMRRVAGTPFAAGTGGKVGLGLAVARLLIEAHGGTLSIPASRRGGMVTVTFPGPKGRR
jgi:signal transduction histidine kinase